MALFPPDTNQKALPVEWRLWRICLVALRGEVRGGAKLNRPACFTGWPCFCSDSLVDLIMDRDPN
jgi:hypothetical protein